jgi:hypothetical protein
MIMKVVSLLTLIFCLIVALARFIPTPDTFPDEILMPADCAAPCFMGIQPGVTHPDDAVAILEAHEWVGEVDDFREHYTSGLIAWDWSGQQPDWINTASRGEVRIRQRMVERVMVATHLPFGDFAAHFGTPNEIRSVQITPAMHSVIMVAAYPSFGLTLLESCRANNGWSATATIWYQGEVELSQFLPLPDVWGGDSMPNNLQAACHTDSYLAATSP